MSNPYIVHFGMNTATKRARPEIDDEFVRRAWAMREPPPPGQLRMNWNREETRFPTPGDLVELKDEFGRSW
jgi:hypothetical protein